MFKKYIILALLTTPATAQSGEDIDCYLIQGKDAIDTQTKQAECFQVQAGWYEERSIYLQARKQYLKDKKAIEALEQEASEATKPAAPVASVEVPQPIVEPEWPRFMFSTADPDGNPIASILFNSTGNSQIVRRGSVLPQGVTVSRIFNKGIEVTWNGTTRVLGSR